MMLENLSLYMCLAGVVGNGPFWGNRKKKKIKKKSKKIFLGKTFLFS